MNIKSAIINFKVNKPDSVTLNIIRKITDDDTGEKTKIPDTVIMSWEDARQYFVDDETAEVKQQQIDKLQKKLDKLQASQDAITAKLAAARAKVV